MADRDRPLPRDELSAQCVMLLFAGHETTRHWIGNSIYVFLRHPDALAQIGRDPSLVRPAMEEVLRFESPVQMFGRTLVRDIEHAGTRIAEGHTLLLVVAAANRDPRQFTDPDRLDIHRPHNRHMTFGGDAHVCLGSTLARLEGTLAVGELVRRFPALRLKEALPQWNPVAAFRGLKSLAVEVT